MKKLNVFAIIFTAAMLLMVNVTITGAQGPPTQPSSFWGTVKVDDANVSDGTEVTAWINGTQQASAATVTYQGNSVYSIAVPNGSDGDTITFQVGGVEADQTGTWQLGENSELNLTASDTPPLDADFTCTPSSGQPPLEVSCTDESTGDIAGWSWDFGDGTSSTEQNPTHTYNLTGTLSVALTVTGSDGSDTESKANYISLSASSMALEFESSNIEMYADQLIDLDLMVKEALDLYGLEVDCSTEADFISLQNATFADLFGSDALIGINNLTSNSWYAALSQKHPAEAVFGDGIFGIVTIKALATGSATFGCTALASDGDGFPLQTSTSPSTITVLPSPDNAIVGVASYQSRRNLAGIQVTATGPTNKSVTTIESGRFELLELSAGSYEVKAEANGHLYNCIQTESPGVLPRSKLLAGDVDNNNVINILDAIQVASVFGQPPTEGAPTDFNMDGTVNINDLAPLGRNFTESRTGCEGW